MRSRASRIRRDARRGDRDRDAQSRRACVLRRQRDAHRRRRVGAGRRDSLVGARQPRRRRDDPARQRAGIAHGAALAGADGRRRLRRGARARGRHPDPSGRHLQRQRALRGEPRAGGRDRGPARAGQRPVRLERGARDHQRDPADAGRDPGFRRRARRRQRRLAKGAARGVAGRRGWRPGPRHARDRRRRLARRLRVRGAEAERRLGAADRRRHAEARALRLEPRPGNGGIHPRRGRLPRPGRRPLEPGSRGVPRRDLVALRGPVPRRLRERAARLPSPLAHGLPAALPAGSADRGQRPGQRRRDALDDARTSAAAR